MSRPNVVASNDSVSRSPLFVQSRVFGSVDEHAWIPRSQIPEVSETENGLPPRPFGPSPRRNRPRMRMPRVLIEPALVVQASIVPPHATNGSLSQVGLSVAVRTRSAVNGPATTLIAGHGIPEMLQVQGLDVSLHEASLSLVVQVPSPEAQSCTRTS